jgi:putative FmdB family regulatory protein
MPTYDYVCPNCGHEFQKFHKMNAKVRPKCPECGTVAQRRITGGAGLHFKGSGFYITDYKKTGKAGETDKADRTDKTDKAGKAGETGKTDQKKSEPKKGDAKPKKGSDS